MTRPAQTLPFSHLRRALGARFVFVFLALGLVLEMAARSANPTAVKEKQRAIAELTAGGLSWDESERTVRATEEGQANLKDLSAVVGALRILQPQSFVLDSCEVLRDVDGLRGLRSLQAIYLTTCPALRNVDGIASLVQLKKVNLFESVNIAPASMDALSQRFPKCYIVFPDGTGIHPIREKVCDE